MSKFKKKFGKRILAFLLSGAMIMSNMTAFASEAPQDTGEEYVREETVVTDENDTEYVEEADADESSKSEDSTADKKDDVKETSAETVEATETSDSKETKETETAKEEQTSETESSLSADTEEASEVETESTEEVSEEETTEAVEEEDDVKAGTLHTFDATKLKAETENQNNADDKKNLVVENEPNFDNYFSVTGNVAKRIKNDGSKPGSTFDGTITCVEVAALGKSSINFTVTGTADVELVMSSTGASNVSAIGLADGSNNIITTDDVTPGETDSVSITTSGIITTKGTKGTTVKYTGLTAGSYKVISPDNADKDETSDAVNTTKRGARVFSIKVTETTGEGSNPPGGDDQEELRTFWDFQNDVELTEKTIEGTTENYFGLEVDATSGKFNRRNNDSNKDLMLNAGTKVKIPVAGKSKVTVVAHSAQYALYKVDEVQASTADATSVFECDGTDGYVLLEATGQAYLFSIRVEAIEGEKELRTFWDFQNDTELTEKTIENTTENYFGLEVDATSGKFNRRNNDSNKDLMLNAGTKVKIPVAGKSKITVVAHSAQYALYKVDGVQASTAEATSVFKCEGTNGYATLEATGQAYLFSIMVDPEPEDDGGNDEGLDTKHIAVWDFNADKLDEEKYINMLTAEDLNNAIGAVEGGQFTSCFTINADDQEKYIEYSSLIQGSEKKTRLYAENPDLNPEKLAGANTKWFANVCKGALYVNAQSPEPYISIYAKAGDVIQVVAGGNNGDSTVAFEQMNVTGAVPQTAVAARDGATLTFYAVESGQYKIYSVDEKLVVGRITREHKEKVLVSGTVTVTSQQKPTNYSIEFKCRETGEVKTAKVTNGKYARYLSEGYTYDVALSDAKEFVVTNENPSFTLAGEGIVVDGDTKTYQYDVTVEAVDLVTVTGSIKGLDPVAGGNQTPLKSLKLGFESDMIYEPELTLKTTTGEFTLTLEKDVEYTLTVEGVDDFELVAEDKKISASESGTKDITFAAKPVYDITIKPEGATKEELATTSFEFSRVNIVENVREYDADYVYTFTGTEGIKLRDGQYEVTTKGCPYIQLLTSDLKVAGQNAEKIIKFSKDPITDWTFSEEEGFTKNTLENYKGLLMSGVSNENGKAHAVSGAGGEYKVPVAGPCKISVSYYYEATGSIENTVDISLAEGDEAYKTTNKVKTSTYEYTGEKGYVTITTTAKTYLTKITAQYAGNKVEYKEKITVGASGCDYTSINDALDVVREMERTADQRVTIEIQPGDYEEMLVVDTPNVTLKNANSEPSIKPINKGVDIEASSVRITSYYGHGYAYYSMGNDCKWDADVLQTNKDNGSLSFINPGSGTTSGSYWNATVVIGADGFEADGIIFENSFNQYMSKKAAEDVIVPVKGAVKEGDVPRASMKAGDTTVQNKKYVERAAALAIMNGYKKINFNNCSFIGHQDTLYGGVEVTAAFYGCDVYGGTDYIFGGMTAVFAKCNLLFNTMEDNNDVGYITAAQQSSGRGYLMYNCRVASTTPGVNTASEKISKPGYFGRPWTANTSEVVFYKTIIEKTNYNGTDESLIVPAGWNDGLGGKSGLSQEYASIELAGVNNSESRVTWAKMLTADEEGKVTLADGNTVVTDDTVVAAFFSDWNPFAGKDMTIITPEVPGPDDPDDPDNPDNPDKPDVVKTIKLDDCVIAVSSILADPKKNPENRPKTSVVYYADKDSEGNPIKPITFAEGLDYEVGTPEQKEDNTWSVTIKGLGREVDEYRIDPDSSLPRTYKVFDKKADKDKIIDLSKAKITIDTKSAVYTGYAIIPKVTSIKVGKEEIADTKYKISYRSNINTGKASVIVSADSDASYVEGEKFVIGTKTVNFTIKKAAINKADQIKVTAKDANGEDLKGKEYDYRGVEAVVAETLLVESSAGKKLRENIDYTVTYKNNRKAGKASLVIKGIGNNVSGTLNIPFTIKPIEVNPETDVYAPYYGMEYSPNGAKAQFILFRRYTNASHTEIADEILLEEGVDFKGSYKYTSKNKEAGSTVKFSGKGMNAFKGIFSESEYIIKPSYFTDGGVYVSSAITVDITKGDLEGAALQKALEKAVVLNDYFGTKLKVNKDYVIEPTVAEDGRSAVIIRPSDATKANYLDGDLSLGYYYNKAKNVGKLKKVEFAKDFVKYYDGRNPVQLTANDIKLLGTYEFELGTHVEIVPGSYKNNYKTGNASVTIRGIAKNGYYGTKTIKFKIKEA